MNIQRRHNQKMLIFLTETLSSVISSVVVVKYQANGSTSTSTLAPQTITKEHAQQLRARRLSFAQNNVFIIDVSALALEQGPAPIADIVEQVILSLPGSVIATEYASFVSIPTPYFAPSFDTELFFSTQKTRAPTL